MTAPIKHPGSTQPTAPCSPIQEKTKQEPAARPSSPERKATGNLAGLDELPSFGKRSRELATAHYVEKGIPKLPAKILGTLKVAMAPGEKAARKNFLNNRATADRSTVLQAYRQEQVPPEQKAIQRAKASLRKMDEEPAPTPHKGDVGRRVRDSLLVARQKDAPFDMSAVLDKFPKPPSHARDQDAAVSREG